MFGPRVFTAPAECCLGGRDGQEENNPEGLVAPLQRLHQHHRPSHLARNVSTKYQHIDEFYKWTLIWWKLIVPTDEPTRKTIVSYLGSVSPRTSTSPLTGKTPVCWTIMNSDPSAGQSSVLWYHRQSLLLFTICCLSLQVSWRFRYDEEPRMSWWRWSEYVVQFSRR